MCLACSALYYSVIVLQYNLEVLELNLILIVRVILQSISEENTVLSAPLPVSFIKYDA